MNLQESGPFDSIQHPKKRAFLAAYSELGSQSRAALIAGVDRTTVWMWRQRDAEFVEAMKVAHVLACESLEDEARRRAVDGVEKPVFQQGRHVGNITEYSDTLLIFLAKGAMPEKYRETWRGEISGPSSGPVQFDLSGLTEDELGTVSKLLERAATRS